MIELEIPESYFDKDGKQHSADIFCTHGKFDKDAVCSYMETKGLLKDLETFARTHVDKKWLVTFKDKTALKQFSAFSPFKCKGSWYAVSSESISEYTIRVLRLPPSVSDEAVSKAMKPKVEKVLEVTREDFREKFGKSRVVRNVKAEMYSHQLAKLPYKMEIQNHEALLKVLEPACSSCGRLGHVQGRCFSEVRRNGGKLSSAATGNLKTNPTVPKSPSPFCIWPQFGAFIDIKRKRPIIDLRWTLPKFFATHL